MCRHHFPPQEGDSSAASSQNAVLQQTEADARARFVVSPVNYKLEFELSQKRSTYKGSCTVTFTLRSEGAYDGLFLDFTGVDIQAFTINDVPSTSWANHRLPLPLSALRLDSVNTVTVVYKNEHDVSGMGLHRFVDPEDSQVYIYSQFEPYDAHRAFPCFDQPDIRATYELSVTAPATFEVIANYPHSSAPTPAGEDSEDGALLAHSFEKTTPFSTYLFALIAGPFASAASTGTSRSGRSVPFTLYCRAALAKHLLLPDVTTGVRDCDEVFTLMSQGLAFYEDCFDFDYPFPKYDQIYCPEFNMGAMENVGAVTFAEHAIFTDPPTESQRMGRCETLLHEMAHMWFGNLVTMKWWNGLWLNESFATYMSYVAGVAATRFGEAMWPAFHADMKAWAYYCDQLSSTHPIELPVSDTEETFANFDGITYGKGAACLKQLCAFVGMDKFRAGLQLYFHRFAWKNTGLVDFLGAIQEASGVNLDGWTQEWLLEPGLNTLALSVVTTTDGGGGSESSGGEASERSGGSLVALSVCQSAPAEWPTLRSHAIEVALIYRGGKGGDGEASVVSFKTHVSGPVTDLSALVAGRPCPAILFPCYGDHVYAKVRLDAGSLETVLQRGGLALLRGDTLLRTQVWRCLYDMMRDGEPSLSSTRFVDLVTEWLPSEPNLELAEVLLDNAASTLRTYMPSLEARQSRSAALHALTKAQWLAAPPSSVANVMWAKFMVSFALASGPLTEDTLGAVGPFGPSCRVAVTQQWRLLSGMAAYALSGVPEATATLAAFDPSEKGVKAQLVVAASDPRPEAKAATWARIVDGDATSSAHDRESLMRGFHWATQEEVTAPYVAAYLSALSTVNKTMSQDFTRFFASVCAPSSRYDVEEVGLPLSQARLLTFTEEEKNVKRFLAEEIDDMKRIIAVRAVARANQ